MNRGPLFVLPLVLIVISAPAVHAQDIDEAVGRWIQQQHVPGASIAVLRNGSVVKAAGYGMADLEHRLQVRPDTVFKIGSVSKQFIATGIMLLVQDGGLAVDDRVSRYLEDTPASWTAITIRHLLTHTAGLDREGPAFDFFKVQPDIDVIRSAYGVPLQFEPGEKWAYSNLGYFVLAEVITRAAGKPWADFMAERVFIPLGMHATRVTSLAEIIPNRARGYAWARDRFQNEDDWPAIRPSGAFVSTVLDLAKWEAALIASQMLKDTTKAEMWKPVVLSNGRTYPYGFGWELDDWPLDPSSPVRSPMIRHEGSMNGFRAGFVRFPGHGLAVIVLTNRSGTPVEGLGATIAVHYVPELKTATASQPAPTAPN